LLAGVVAGVGALLLGSALLEAGAALARRAWWRINPAAAERARLRRVLAAYQLRGTGSDD
jgi:HAMP domain-containing protein